MTLTRAETKLAQLDPLLGELIHAQNMIPLSEPRNYFEALSSAIISQQISVKAAAKIFERFQEATQLLPERVLALDEDGLRAVGLSGQKARYIRDLALHFVEDPNVFNHLETLNDEEVIAELTNVKGIGTWTAHMFLIFTLHRPDVFAPDDRGLQLACEKLYNHAFTRGELIELADSWLPYRSIACLHLWKSLDNEPTSLKTS